MRNFNSITIVLTAYLIVAAVSCGNNQSEYRNVKTVSIDASQIKVLPLDSGKIISLESNDSSLLFDIVDVVPVGQEYVIQSRDLLKRFDKNNGKYKGEIAVKGKGRGQFNMIGRFWNENDDTLRLFDSNLGLVLKYDSLGNFLGETCPFIQMPEFSGVTLRPTTIFTDPSSNAYIALNGYVGSTVQPTPAYSYIPKDGSATRILPGRYLQSGGYLFDLGFEDCENNRLLVWEALRDTLFSVDADGVNALYAFDFGSNSFPSQYQAQKELYQRISAFTTDSLSDYISLLRYFQSKGSNLYFSYAHSNNKSVGYAAYNENTGQSHLITFEDSTHQYRPAGFIKVIEDSALVALTNYAHPELNPVLYKFPISLFEN